MYKYSGMFPIKTIRYIFALLILVLQFFIFQNTHAESVKPEYLPNIEKSKSRLIHQPNGPFAVILFNEFAQGLHIGVIYYDQMGNPMDGKWWISERFWQSRKWGSDVKSICWDSTGEYLFVTTSRIYGDGGVFRLNLRQKSSVRIYPDTDIKSSDILSTEIVDINNEKNIITIKTKFSGGKEPKLVTLQME